MTLRVEAFFINDGTIQNLGFIDVYLTLDSHGTLGIASGARVHVNPGAELYNGTLIDNDGTLINQSFLKGGRCISAAPPCWLTDRCLRWNRRPAR